MIKDNQKLLNLMHVVVDAIIIALSYILAWSLRFEDTWSPLVQWRIIPAPIGYIRPRQDYINMLVFLVPCYLIIYYFCNLYNPKRTSSRRTELFNLSRAGGAVRAG